MLAHMAWALAYYNMENLWHIPWKSLTDAETQYVGIEKELLAVVYTFKNIHIYFCGCFFTMETDNKFLETIAFKFNSHTLTSTKDVSVYSCMTHNKAQAWK